MNDYREGEHIAKKSDWIDQIIQLRLQGLSAKQSLDRLDGLDEVVFYNYYQEAGEKIREAQENDVLSTRVLHAQRYEWFYEWFEENDFDKYALKTLTCIERLLGLHSNTIGFSIHNLIEKKEDKPNIYDYTKLTDEELKRLEYLVNKCK